MHIAALLSVFSIFCSSALAASSSFPPDLSHGLGISLSSGYGTVSAYFPNGTYVNIAKVEGDTQYKTYMRDVLSNSTIEGIPGQLPLQSMTPCPLPELLCRYWPSERQPPRPLSLMVGRLKNAAEDRLKKHLRMVEIGVPHTAHNNHGDPSHQVSIALRDSHLYPFRYPQDNGEFAARAHGLCCHSPSNNTPWSAHGGICATDDPDRIILTAENSRAAMTATLWLEDSGVYDLVDRIHSIDLGQNALARCYYRTQHPHNRTICDQKVEDAIRDITKTPIRYAMHTYDRISNVVVFGEGSEDQNLNDIIKSTLGKQNADSTEDGFVRHGRVDPTFAAANALAEHSLQLKVESMDMSGTPIGLIWV